MENKIRVGIVGYGNLGKGVRKAINQNKDIELEAIFTRREVSKVSENDNLMVHISKIGDFKDRIDVMILCGGSATDLVEQGPMVAEMFNTVDSFDTHAKIPSYFEKMNEVSTASGNLSIISVGWDPGLFSLNRLLGNAVLPNGKCISLVRKTAQHDYYEHFLNNCCPFCDQLTSNGILMPKMPRLKCEGVSIIVVPIIICL